MNYKKYKKPKVILLTITSNFHEKEDKYNAAVFCKQRVI